MRTVLGIIQFSLVQFDRKWDEKIASTMQYAMQ